MKPKHVEKKRRRFTNRIIILAAVILILVVVIVGVSMIGKSPPPYPMFSNISASSKKPSSPCVFHVLWADDVNVSGYIFGTNNTGSFQNDTWVPFSSFQNSTAASSVVAKALNDTMGNVVQWEVWCNDTNNNWRGTGLQSILLGPEPNKVLLKTTMGDIVVTLWDDMPITAGNFKNLVGEGVYDGVLFYRVEPGFVIQAGPAGSGQDTSIPAIMDEFSSHNKNLRGTIAMAKTSSPNSATSEFFINLVDNNSLDSTYSVFGEVTSGMDTVDRIGTVAVVQDQTTGMNKPVQDIKITKAEIVN